MPKYRQTALVLGVNEARTFVYTVPGLLGIASMALTRDNIDHTPLLINGEFQALWIPHENGRPDGFSERVARLLTGYDEFLAYAYEPFHECDVTHTHAFQRTWIPFSPDVGRVVISVVESDELADPGDRDAWVFGHPKGLERAAKVAEKSGFTVDAMEGPDGPEFFTFALHTPSDRDRMIEFIDHSYSFVGTPFVWHSPDGA